ncbi:MAG: hypothetical protein KAV00_01480, partial [Phycisphaerae bacterium]|nr:hypothetical protein [Phycisphaerae bacterium]
IKDNLDPTHSSHNIHISHNALTTRNRRRDKPHSGSPSEKYHESLTILVHFTPYSRKNLPLAAPNTSARQC